MVAQERGRIIGTLYFLWHTKCTRHAMAPRGSFHIKMMLATDALARGILVLVLVVCIWLVALGVCSAGSLHCINRRISENALHYNPHDRPTGESAHFCYLRTESQLCCSHVFYKRLLQVASLLSHFPNFITYCPLVPLAWK